MPSIDVAALLDEGPFDTIRKQVVALSAVAIIFDGFDNQVVGFAIPAIVADWHIPRTAFSPILIVGLIAMSLGALIAGYIGDRFGRRTALAGTVLLFGLATTATFWAHSVSELLILRALATAGIGGALPNAATISAEFTPLRRRAFAVMVTIVCVPLGGAIAGSAASQILPAFGWRALFLVGGIPPLLLAMVILAVMPETPRFLARHKERWDELTRLLRRLGETIPDGSRYLDRHDPSSTTANFARLFETGQRTRDTLALWLAFFFCLGGVYLCFNWLPSLLSSRGLNLGSASAGLAAYNYGGVVGVLSFAVLVNRFGTRQLTLLGAALAAAGAVMLMLTPLKEGYVLLAMLAFHGCFANAVQTTLYAIAAHIYPTSVRSTGVGLAAVAGRIGGIFSASIGAAVIQSGPQMYFEALVVAMMIAFAGLWLIDTHVPATAQ